MTVHFIPCTSHLITSLSLSVHLSQLVIAALKCHKYDKSIQVTGSAALFYLTNTEYRSDQSVRLRREVIEVVLNGMEQYQEVTVSLLRQSDHHKKCINTSVSFPF